MPYCPYICCLFLQKHPKRLQAPPSEANRNLRKDPNEANNRTEKGQLCIQFNQLWVRCCSILTGSHRTPEGSLVTETEILMERSGVTVVRSVAHDTENTERLLSKCFSQGSPPSETSSARAHRPMKRFSGGLALQFSKAAAGMGLFDAETSTWMREELNEQKLRPCASNLNIFTSAGFFIRLFSSNLSRLSLGRT